MRVFYPELVHCLQFYTETSLGTHPFCALSHEVVVLYVSYVGQSIHRSYNDTKISNFEWHRQEAPRAVADFRPVKV